MARILLLPAKYYDAMCTDSPPPSPLLSASPQVQLTYNMQAESWSIGGKTRCNDANVATNCEAVCEAKVAAAKNSTKLADLKGHVSWDGKNLSLAKPIKVNPSGWDKPEYNDKGFEGTQCRSPYAKEPVHCPHVALECDLASHTCKENIYENDWTFGYHSGSRQDVMRALKIPMVSLDGLKVTDSRYAHGPWKQSDMRKLAEKIQKEKSSGSKSSGSALLKRGTKSKSLDDITNGFVETAGTTHEASTKAGTKTALWPLWNDPTPTTTESPTNTKPLPPVAEKAAEDKEDKEDKEIVEEEKVEEKKAEEKSGSETSQNGLSAADIKAYKDYQAGTLSSEGMLKQLRPRHLRTPKGMFYLADQEYCGTDEKLCKSLCISEAATSKEPAGSAPHWLPFAATLNWFCATLPVHPCFTPTERMSPCRDKLQCDSRNICVKERTESAAGSTGAEGGMFEGMVAMADGGKGACLESCESARLCTGPAGMGLQQLTRYSKNSDSDPGQYKDSPSSPYDVQVFATGMCFECKAGPDGHFRCPKSGRRGQMQGLLPTKKRSTFDKGGVVKEPETPMDRLSRAVGDALYAGPDHCFDDYLATHLRDSSPEGKSRVTMTVCNERLEVPPSILKGDDNAILASDYGYSVKYTGSMLITGPFSASFVDGTTSQNMDTRIFNYGYELTVDKSGKESSFPRKADPKSSDNKRCTFLEPDSQSREYRKRLLEFYGLYWRKRVKMLADFTPCLPEPTMDFRESVEPSTGKIRYAHVAIFGREVALDDPEIKWKSTRDFYPCKEKAGFLNGMVSMVAGAVGLGAGTSGIVCAQGNGQMASRLAALHTAATPKELKPEEINQKFDLAVSFVMRVVGNNQGTGLSKLAEKTDFRKDLKAKFRNCDRNFWRKLFSSGMTQNDVFGVVDEVVFYNHVLRGEDDQKRLIKTERENTLMYGGTVCATFNRESNCFQYAIPMKYVLATKDLPGEKEKDKGITAGTFEYYSNPAVWRHVQIHLGAERPATDDHESQCRTGLVEESVRYYYEKKWMRRALKKTPAFQGTKCPGSMIK